ncbi:MAG TPA: hypothetical protein VFT62_07740 [Mycobacteriales bacterium]|nr:hypothetical protein [Mycobacteriales bacterium]
MRVRVLTLAAAFGVVAAVVPAHAAKAPKPQITDPAGDANGINDQGFGIGAPPSTATPVDDSNGDITSLALATTYKTSHHRRVPTGATMTLSLSAAPDSNHFYVVTVTTKTCKALEFIYDTNPVPLYAQNRALCTDSTPSKEVGGVPAAVVKGNSLTWRLPLTVFPVGTTFSAISAQTLTGAVPAVVIDETDPSSVTFTVGK